MASSLHLLVLLLLTLVLCSRPASSDSNNDEEAAMARRYAEWMIKYGRTYLNDEEKQHRFEIFKSNVKYIEDSNSKPGRPYNLRINEFADLTREEFRATHLGSLLSNTTTSSSLPFTYSNYSEPPPSIDWRTEDAVTPVKNQDQCGSCWAFSAVAAMEGIVKIATGKKMNLSEQELLDCTPDTEGCGGGNFDSAFQFVIDNGGITTGENYPYTKEQGYCDETKRQDYAASITNYSRVPANDEASLMLAVAKQPISVFIDSSSLDPLFGGGVIFAGPCGTNLDHEVAIVGYGTDPDSGMNYWIVKNSWGTSWGDDGYILMQKDVDQPEGLCGIAMYASYPVIS